MAREARKHHVCPDCKQEDKRRHGEILTCDYCGKQFYRSVSKIENSASGLHFCCRACKDKAQQVKSGEKFTDIRPEHYRSGLTNYRQKALNNYPNRCTICG